MNKSSRSRPSLFALPFGITVAIAILVYILRGIGILSFIPGGILLILMAFSFILGIAYGIDKTKRF